MSLPALTRWARSVQYCTVAGSQSPWVQIFPAHPRAQIHKRCGQREAVAFSWATPGDACPGLKPEAGRRFERLETHGACFVPHSAEAGALRLLARAIAGRVVPMLHEGYCRQHCRQYGALRREQEESSDNDNAQERARTAHDVQEPLSTTDPRPPAKTRSKSRLSGRRPDARLPAAGKVIRQRNFEQNRRRERTAREKWEDSDEVPRTPSVLLAIIGANCVVFLIWQNTYTRRFMGKHFAVSSAGVLKEGRYHTLITSIFSHYDVVHLGANMGCLLFFGKEVVAILGRTRFAAMFIASGLVSSLAQVAWPLIAPPQSRYSQYQLGLGASGAVNAVVAYNILTYPGRILMLLMVLPMPAIVPGLLFLGKDVVGMFAGVVWWCLMVCVLEEEEGDGWAGACARWLCALVYCLLEIVRCLTAHWLSVE